MLKTSVAQNVEPLCHYFIKPIRKLTLSTNYIQKCNIKARFDAETALLSRLIVYRIL